MKKRCYPGFLALALSLICRSGYADTQSVRELDLRDIYTYNYNASHWIEQGNLQEGCSLYGEIEHPITRLPEILKGVDFIQTAYGSKNFKGEIIASFRLDVDADVFVMLHSGVCYRPVWLNDYMETGEEVLAGTDRYKVLRKHFLKGTEVLLGNNGNTNTKMYTVAVKPSVKPEVKLPSGKIFDVRKYGAVGDNRTMNTKALQAAIDACSVAKNGVVYIRDGVYLSGTLELKDNVTLYVERGAILRGSQNHADYPRFVSEFPSFRSKEDFQFLYAEGRKNIRITGGGIIDGNSIFEGSPWRGKGNEHERPRLIRMVKCNQVNVDDITLIRSANWTQYYEACENLSILDCRARCYTGTHNQDGMDISGCRNVVIRNFNGLCGDDVICLKSLSMAVGENILIDGVRSRYANCHLLKIGTETHGGLKNLIARNIEGSARYGIAIECVDGAQMENITYENILLHNCATPLFIRLGSRGRTFEGGPNPAPQGTLKNVTVRNVRNTGIGYVEVRNGPGVGSAIGGLPAQKIENLTIEDCDLLYFGSIMDEQFITREIPENAEKYPEFNIYGTCPAYGLYFRHIDGLKCKNLTIRVQHTDIRPAVVFDDVQNVEVTGINGESFPFTTPSVIWYKDQKK